MTAEVQRLTPEMQEAYIAWDPGFEPREPLTVSQLGFVRAAYFEGWVQAINLAVAIAERWRDENKAAASRAAVRDRKLRDIDMDIPGMADQLRGAAVECNAIAGAIRALASCDTHPKDGDGVATAPLVSGAVPNEDSGDAHA